MDLLRSEVVHAALGQANVEVAAELKGPVHSIVQELG